MQVAACQFLDFHAGVVGAFLQKVLGVPREIDDDFFFFLILVAGQQRAGADSFTENVNNFRVFDELFAQLLYGLNAAELEGVCFVGVVLRYAADVDFAVVDGDHQRNARLVGDGSPVVGVGDLYFLFFANGVKDDRQIFADVFVNARGRSHEQNTPVQFLRIMRQGGLFAGRQILCDSFG